MRWGIFLFVASMLAGLFACFLYVALLDKFCPVDHHAPLLTDFIGKLRPEGASETRGKNQQYGKENQHGPILAAFTPAQANEQQHGTESANKHEKPRKWVAVVCEVKAADVALVFFTYCLVLVTGWLVRATAALAAADRPHLLPTEFTISGLCGDAVDGQIHCPFHYRFTNSGKSPAFVKRYSLNIWVADTLEDQLPKRAKYRDVVETNYIISPIAGWYGSLQPSMLHIPPEAAAVIVGGKGRIVVFGFVEYADAGESPFKIRFAFGFDFGPDGKSTRYFPAGSKRYWEYR